MADKTQEHKGRTVPAHSERSGSARLLSKPGWQLRSRTATGGLLSRSGKVPHSPTNTPTCPPEKKPFNNFHGEKLLTALPHPSAPLTANDARSFPQHISECFF